MKRQLTALASSLRLSFRPRLRCSFCGRSDDRVGRLVAGPNVYICDACTKACVAVLEQHGGFDPPPAETG